MKKIVVVTSLLLSVAFNINAQSTLKVSQAVTAPWTPETGYWVVESNLKIRKAYMVLFYTNEGSLIYSEHISGVKLNIKKRKTLMKLKNALDATMLAWEKSKKVRENEMLVMNSLKKR